MSEEHYLPSEQGGRKGHPDFYKYLEAMAVLHSDKNAEYTQGGDPLGNFKRVSAILAI